MMIAYNGPVEQTPISFIIILFPLIHQMAQAVRNLDLEQIVRDWGWRAYDATANRKRRKLREKQKKNPDRKYIAVSIDWSGVRFR